MKRTLVALLAGPLLLIASPATAAGYPDPRPVTGDTVVHDPSAVRLADGTYIIYSTHGGLEARTSRDGLHWQRAGSAFTALPQWWYGYSPDGDPWAPDLSYRNGRYWLYYAVSSFGSNHSAIGLATSATGRPGSWQDQGIVYASEPGDDHNAIDPGLVDAGADGLWMSFGSYWTGIRMIRLDRTTGLAHPTDAAVRQLATRPDLPYAVEAPYIVKRGGYYYLFASYDACCAGTSSTYKIKVGRSSSVTGPYTDRAGVPMLQGGGELLLATHDRYIGPGGQSVLRSGGRDTLVYHYYDGDDGGTPKLGLNTLTWGADGWPALS